jgi:hypothetical protein
VRNEGKKKLQTRNSKQAQSLKKKGENVAGHGSERRDRPRSLLVSFSAFFGACFEFGVWCFLAARLIRNIIETRAASGGSLPAAQAVFGRTRREFQLVSVLRLG